MAARGTQAADQMCNRFAYFGLPLTLAKGQAML